VHPSPIVLPTRRTGPSGLGANGQLLGAPPPDRGGGTGCLYAGSSPDLYRTGDIPAGVSGLAFLERQRPSGDRRALLLSREQIGDTLGVAQQTVNRDLALNTKMSNDDPPEGRG
jgi:hypothetical protein